MKYSYLDMAELDFRYAYIAYETQLLKNKDYGIRKTLSAVDTHVLDHIGKNKGITLTQLSEHMMRKKSTLSPVVNTLLEDGLIEKEQNSRDKRSFGLVLSQKGREVLERHYQYNQKLYKAIADFIIHQYGEEYLDAYYEIVSMKIRIVEDCIKTGNGNITAEDVIQHCGL